MNGEVKKFVEDWKKEPYPNARYRKGEKVLLEGKVCTIVWANYIDKDEVEYALEEEESLVWENDLAPFEMKYKPVQFGIFRVDGYGLIHVNDHEVGHLTTPNGVVVFNTESIALTGQQLKSLVKLMEYQPHSNGEG